MHDFGRHPNIPAFVDKRRRLVDRVLIYWSRELARVCVDQIKRRLFLFQFIKLDQKLLYDDSNESTEISVFSGEGSTPLVDLVETIDGALRLNKKIVDKFILFKSTSEDQPEVPRLLFIVFILKRVSCVLFNISHRRG